METLEKFREYRDEVEKLKSERPEMFITPNTVAEGNKARIEGAIQLGYDLVETTTHHPTCEKCAIFQGRIYSISGNDKRFPPLSVVFLEGTYCIHKGCKHVFLPWVESMHTKEEIEEAIAFSNRPFTDPRTQQEKDDYDRLQYYIFKQYMDGLDYQNLQKLLPDIAPKSFSGYRRMKNAKTANYLKLVEKAKEVGLDIDKYR